MTHMLIRRVGVYGLYCNQPSGGVRDLFLMLSIFILGQGLTHLQTFSILPSSPPSRHVLAKLCRVDDDSTLLSSAAASTHRKAASFRKPLNKGETCLKPSIFIWWRYFPPPVISGSLFSVCMCFVCRSFRSCTWESKILLVRALRFISRQEICSSAAFFKSACFSVTEAH